MKKYADAVLSVVQHSTGHLTAEQIFLKLKETVPGIALATVYNNLNYLCEQRMIRKLSVEGFPDRYDRMTRHDHLVCSKCGRLSDITLDDLTEVLQAQIKEHILSYDLRIRHLCPECRKAQEEYESRQEG